MSSCRDERGEIRGGEGEREREAREGGEGEGGTSGPGEPRLSPQRFVRHLGAPPLHHRSYELVVPSCERVCLEQAQGREGTGTSRELFLRPCEGRKGRGERRREKETHGWSAIVSAVAALLVVLLLGRGVTGLRVGRRLVRLLVRRLGRVGRLALLRVALLLLGVLRVALAVLLLLALALLVLLLPALVELERLLEVVDDLVGRDCHCAGGTASMGELDGPKGERRKEREEEEKEEGNALLGVERAWVVAAGGECGLQASRQALGRSTSCWRCRGRAAARSAASKMTARRPLALLCRAGPVQPV